MTDPSISPAIASLLAKHAPDALVAFGAGGNQTCSDLLHDAANVAAALPEPANSGAEVLLVFRQDRYAFAAALLGAWSKGYAVTLPPNQRGETIAQLLNSRRVQTLLHDTGAGGHISVPALLGARNAAPNTAPLGVINPPPIAAYALTSGSTGQSEAWPKTTGQLLGEVAGLVRTFAAQPGQRYVVTVPPTHLYGLLFGVLLPLASGGAFIRETPLLPEAFAARVREHDAQVLVSVPIHLRAAHALAPGSLLPLKRVFSSTAPLHEATAKDFSARHSLPINEIFGSTETGGIAQRDRTRHPGWQPFDVVRVSTDAEGRLVVQSPYCPDANKPYPSADRVELAADGTFSHAGRDDGVVKVGGLRVSLPSLEDWLMQYPGVIDCAVVAVPELARGVRVLCALSAPDVQESTLREAMARHFEPSTLPKRFLFLERLPREANGKLQRAGVLRLFGLGPDGKPLSTSLEFTPPTAQAENPLRFEASTRVPEDYVWYGGHFDGYPVMAGIVQLHEVVCSVANRCRAGLGEIRSLQKVKFLGRIAPGDSINVELTFDASTAECDFSIRKGAETCSAGRVAFFPAVPAALSAAQS